MAEHIRHARFRNKDRSDGLALIRRFDAEIYGPDGVKAEPAPASVAAIIDKGRDIAALVDEYYEPDEPGLQGLKSVTWLIDEHTADRVDDLADAVREADTQYLLAREKEEGVAEEAQRLLSQMRVEVGMHLKRSGGRLPRELRGKVSRRGLVRGLWMLSRISHIEAEGLAAMPNFDPEWSVKAFDLSAEVERANKPVLSALRTRDRLVTLMVSDLRKVREAAAYLWRMRRPDIEKLFHLSWSPRRPRRPRAAQPSERADYAADDTATD